jgi:acylphosphatase
MITRRVVISGRVQGVGFRAFVKSHTKKLPLNGFVRNRTDGTVEAVFSGNEADVSAIIALCHEGPMSSMVTKVDITEENSFIGQGFEQLPTSEA